MTTHHKPIKRLVEVCPQCCQSVSSSDTRLVQDSCGHSKCRICLLTENTGCLLCAAKQSKQNAENAATSQSRKSVITSLAIQQSEQTTDVKEATVALSQCSPPIVDKETCQILNQTLDKEILFPTEIVKRSTGNFYHLKRIFSERFFNEDKQRDETDLNCKSNEKDQERNIAPACDEVVEESKGEGEIKWRVPNHIEVRYYCTIHQVSFKQKHNIIRNHLTCSFSQSSQININPDNSVSCKLCSKTYKSVGKLNRHLNCIHKQTSNFKCEDCGKLCKDNYHLNKHQVTHTKEKPFVCQSCGQGFTGKHNYLRHQKKHNGQSNFICDDCGFRFLTSTELKAHRLTHTKSKRFTCTTCHKEFALKRTLTRHRRIHDNDREILTCHSCGSEFKRKDNLERHFKIIHQDSKSPVPCV